MDKNKIFNDPELYKRVLIRTVEAFTDVLEKHKDEKDKGVHYYLRNELMKNQVNLKEITFALNRKKKDIDILGDFCMSPYDIGLMCTCGVGFSEYLDVPHFPNESNWVDTECPTCGKKFKLTIDVTTKLEEL
jgi:hypothetical protein